MAAKKLPVYQDPAAGWLRRLSKTALVDLVIDRTTKDDESVSVADARNAAGPVLRLRGDRIPPIRRRR